MTAEEMDKIYETELPIGDEIPEEFKLRSKLKRYEDAMRHMKKIAATASFSPLSAIIDIQSVINDAMAEQVTIREVSNYSGNDPWKELMFKIQELDTKI